MQNTAAGVTGQRDMGVKEVSYKDVLAFKKNTIFPYVLSNGTLHFNRLHLYIIIQAPEVPNHR